MLLKDSNFFAAMESFIKNNMTSVEPVIEARNQKQRENSFCSSCGLCSVQAWPVEQSIKSCVFTNGWLGEREKKLFGRERSLDEDD